MIKEIVLKIDCNYLIEKRLKRIESVKFDPKFPMYFKKSFIKDCEEYIEILKSITEYTTTAKNLAYVIVFHKLWSHTDFDNETLIRIFDNIVNDVDMPVEDLELYLAYKETFNFTNLSVIIDKYKSVSDYKHTSIRDRVIFEGLHKDVYENAYNYFNITLDNFIANIENSYNEYVESLEENIEPLSLEDFKKSLIINGSQLIEDYYTSLNK